MSHSFTCFFVCFSCGECYLVSRKLRSFYFVFVVWCHFLLHLDKVFSLKVLCMCACVWGWGPLAYFIAGTAVLQLIVLGVLFVFLLVIMMTLLTVLLKYKQDRAEEIGYCRWNIWKYRVCQIIKNICQASYTCYYFQEKSPTPPVAAANPLHGSESPRKIMTHTGAWWNNALFM